MRMIIEARIVSCTGTEKVISLADIDRVDGDFKQLGLKLSEGRDLMHDVQHALVNAQTTTFVEACSGPAGRARHQWPLWQIFSRRFANVSWLFQSQRYLAGPVR